MSSIELECRSALHCYPWTPKTSARISIEMYEAGHMMYVHPPSLEKYKVDLARFVLDNDGQD